MAGRLSRSSISLSNGFLFNSSFDINEHSSKVSLNVANDIAKPRPEGFLTILLISKLLCEELRLFLNLNFNYILFTFLRF